MPDQDWTVEQRSKAFILLSAADCEAEENFTREHSRYPMKMSRLLCDSSIEGEILRDPDCLLDEWSREFRRKYQGSPNGLRGSESIAVLRLHCRVGKTNIKGIEARHASIRRHLMAKGVQTWAQDFEECAAEFLCQQARKAGAFDVISSAMEGEGDEAQSACDEDGSGDAVATRPGGPWRAFVRKASLGKAGLQDQAELSRQYTALSPEERAELVAVGKAATRSPNQGPGSSFGPRTRDVQRLQAVRAKEAVVTLAPGRGLQQLQGRGFGEMCEFAINQAMVSCQGLSAVKMLAAGRAVLRHAKALGDAPRARAEAQLQQWQAQHGHHACLLAGRLLPTLQPFVPHLLATPSNRELVVGLQPPLLGAASVVQAFVKKARQSNLGKSLELDWSGRCRPIMHSECEPIDEDKGGLARLSRAACFKVGICICGPNKELGRLRQKFYQALKRQCPAKTPGNQEGTIKQMCDCLSRGAMWFEPLGICRLILCVCVFDVSWAPAVFETSVAHWHAWAYCFQVGRRWLQSEWSCNCEGAERWTTPHGRLQRESSTRMGRAIL